MGTDTTGPRPDASAGGRIRGIDLARGLAILGMLAVHVGPTNLAGTAGRLYAAPHGRASLLFVLVAGVGVSLLARSRSTSSREARWRLGWRALLLLPMGLALQELDHGANVILQDYALLFVVAIVALGLPDRWLLGLAAAASALGPVAFLWGQGRAPEVFDRASTSLTDPVGEVLHGLVLSGPYPLITWIAPFLLGMWLGRRDLRAGRARARLMVIGGLVAAGSLVAARGLVAVLGPPTTPGDLRFLATSAAHGQMPLWLVGGTGAAAAVLGASLVVADAWPRLSWPVRATGQLALTAYVGHLLVLHLAPARLTSDELGGAVALLAVFSTSIGVAATMWRAAFERGPLEQAFHAVSIVPARRRGPAPGTLPPAGPDGSPQALEVRTWSRPGVGPSRRR